MLLFFQEGKTNAFLPFQSYLIVLLKVIEMLIAKIISKVLLQKRITSISLIDHSS